jgi:hypothetical protein
MSAGDLSEDYLQSVIRGHPSVSVCWTVAAIHTFQPVVEVKVRVHRTPRLLSACA